MLWTSGHTISEIHDHAQSVRVRHQSEAKLLWRATRSFKHGVENAGSSTFSGSKEAMKSQGFAKTWRTKYGAVQRSKCAFYACFSSDIYFFHTIRDVYRNVLPARGAKPRFECSKRMIVKVASRFSPLSGK